MTPTDSAPIRGRWTITTYGRTFGPPVDEDVEVVPVPDEAAIERGAKAARKIPPGARDRWQRVAEAVLRAALEPPEAG